MPTNNAKVKQVVALFKKQITQVNNLKNWSEVVTLQDFYDAVVGDEIDKTIKLNSTANKIDEAITKARKKLIIHFPETEEERVSIKLNSVVAAKTRFDNEPDFCLGDNDWWVSKKNVTEISRFGSVDLRDHIKHMVIFMFFCMIVACVNLVYFWISGAVTPIVLFTF